MNTHSALQSTPKSSVLRQAGLLGSSYILGAFNDNFFKQAVLLLAVQAGHASLQSWGTLLFALPFVVFSSAAGWLADRYAKKTLVVWAKAIEIGAMLTGAWGLITFNWPCLLAMICLMGFKSTLFSPALNGSIPELFAEHDVPRVNALFKLGTTVAILLGIALAGGALDQCWWETAWPFGRALVAAGALFVAAAGFVAALLMPARAAAGSDNPFPALPLVDSFAHLRHTRRTDPALYTALLAETFFYFLSTLLLLEINRLGLAQLGLSFTLTSALCVALMVGICGGSLIASRTHAQSWQPLTPPALWGMAASLCAVGYAPHLAPPFQLTALFALYILAGACGGLYLIPLSSFIQIRPAPTDKGKVLGLANTLDFSGILLAGQLYLLLEMLPPSMAHMALGGLAGLAALLFRRMIHARA